VSINRDTVLKTAEKLLRVGKLDEAIEQYVRLVDQHPQDWNAINTLGDLYVRAGNADRAVAQYVRIADNLFDEGFLPKAAALYKKALKACGDHDHTLVRLSDIAAQQGLLADAKLYLRQLARQRQTRGDERGAAECIVRMAAIDEDDADAKIEAARIAEGMGDIPQAVALFQDAARVYEKEQRDGDALNSRVAAAGLSPGDAELRDEVARALIAAGQFDRARPFLSADSVGDDVELLLLVGRHALLTGRQAEAQAALMRAAALAPDRQDAIASLADDLIAAGRAADAYACVEILVDAALFEAAFERATRLLEDFVARQAHVPALLKLVDVCVDAGFDDRVTAVQGRLADAYLENGQSAEARVIAEDLVSREPGVEHLQRLRRALLALGVDDPDAAVARRPAVEAETITPPQSLHVERPGAANLASAAASWLAPVTTRRESAAPPVSETSEIDLSSVLAELHVTPRILSRDDAPAPTGEERGAEEMPSWRAAVAAKSAEAAALLERAQEHLRRGHVMESASALQAAAHVLAAVMELEADAGLPQGVRTSVERSPRGSRAAAAGPNGETP